VRYFRNASPSSRIRRHVQVTPKEGEEYGKFDDFIDYTVFNETTECGILGDATIATAEKGKVVVERCVDRIAEYMHEKFGC